MTDMVNDGTGQDGMESGGLGQRLRDARGRLGISPEEVSERLRLDKRVILALENEDFAALPGPAFILGYLRSYARFLELPADDIVRAYQVQDQPPELLPDINYKPQARSSDAPVRLVTYLIVAGLVVLLVAWWISQNPLGTAPPEEAAAEVVVAAPEPRQAAQAPDQAAGDAEIVLVPPPVEDGDAAPVPVVAPPPAAASAPRVAVPEPPEQSFRVEAPIAAANVMHEPAGDDVLVLRYTDDSWTEVTDASGERLVYNLIEEGRVLRLQGLAPFSIFLGNSPAVTLEYNGDAFDQTPFNRRELARFQVGSASPE